MSPPPARPNSAPRANLAPSIPLTLSDRVSSTLVHDAWASYLQDYPDPQFVSTILHIIKYGANVGFTGEMKEQASLNLRSALENPDVVSSDYSKLLSQGRLHGPFPTPPLTNFRSSPLGVVFRKRTTKARLIHHLSAPHGASVNDGILDSEASISYDFFQRAVEDLQAAGPGALMGKLDLLQAFRHIPVRLADRALLGSNWQGSYYYSPVLTFGLRSAPYIFNLFAEALHWIIQRHIPARIRHYLDDYLTIYSPSTPPHIALAGMEWIQALGAQLGLFFQEEKTVNPGTLLEFLGLELDSQLMEARLPADKLEFLRSELTSWLSRRSCSLREIQELTGYLQFCSQVIPSSRAFIRRLIDFSTTFPSHSLQSRRHIPSSARADLKWWHSLAASWNGIQLIPSSRVVHDVYTDASGTKGIGGVFGLEWFASRVPRRHRGFRPDGRPVRDIQFKELYAIVDAVLRWGNQWRGSHVVFHCDNQAVVAALNSLTNRSPPTMGLLRFFLGLAACLDFSFTSVWLSSANNALADAASRFDYKRLFGIAPDLRLQSSSKDPLIPGIAPTPTTRRRQPCTSTTVSPPALGKPIKAGSIHTSDSSTLTRNTNTLTAPVFPLRSPHFSSGAPPSAAITSPPPLRRTSPTSDPPTSKKTSPTSIPTLPFSNVSSAASLALTTPLPRSCVYPLPPTCSGKSSSVFPPRLDATALSFVPHALWHSQRSLDAGNSPFPRLPRTSRQHFISLPDPFNGFLHSNPPHTSPSASPPPKPIPSVSASPSSSPPPLLARPHALSPQCTTSSPPFPQPWSFNLSSNSRTGKHCIASTLSRR